MSGQRITKYLKSYVIIKLNSKNCEKILNLLRRKQIIVWDIIKKEDGIEFKISRKHYESNKTFFDEINIYPIKKVGTIYTLSKLSVRIGFIAGAVLIFLYIAIYSSFIWEIRIVGLETLNTNDIITTIEEVGYKTPVSVSKVDKLKIENYLYKKYDKLKFVEAYVEGVKLIIFVKEKKEIQYEKFDDSPSSVVAAKQAVIFKTVVKQGKLLVKEGDVVSKGQVLVQGIKKVSETENMLVSSDAQILGYTYYNITLTEPKVHTIYKETGKKNKIRYIIFNDKEIKVFGNKDKFAEKDEKESLIRIPIISDFLHISFKNTTQYELKAESDIISSSYALNKLKINAYEELMKKCNYNNCKLVKEDIIMTEDDKSYIMNIKIQLIEDIGSYIRIYDLQPANLDI